MNKLSISMAALAEVAMPGIVAALAPHTPKPELPDGLTDHDLAAIERAREKRLRKSHRAHLDRAAGRR